jgi:hypothetical protein
VGLLLRKKYETSFWNNFDTNISLIHVKLICTSFLDCIIIVLKVVIPAKGAVDTDARNSKLVCMRIQTWLSSFIYKDKILVCMDDEGMGYDPTN